MATDVCKVSHILENILRIEICWQVMSLFRALHHALSTVSCLGVVALITNPTDVFLALLDNI